MSATYQKVYENETIHLDGQTYVNCEFRSCHFVYSGGDLGEFGYNRLVDPKVRLDGPAQNTVDFLRACHQGGMQFFAEEVIAYIRGAGTRRLPIQ